MSVKLVEWLSLLASWLSSWLQNNYPELIVVAITIALYLYRKIPRRYAPLILLIPFAVLYAISKLLPTFFAFHLSNWPLIAIVLTPILIIDLLHKIPKNSAPYFFISPFFILFAIFGFFPILFSIYISFQQWNPTQGLEAMKFLGKDDIFRNYLYVLTDPIFWKSVYNTFWLAITSGLAQHLMAIPLAFILVMGLKRLRHPFTAFYFLPYITSTVAIALVFNTIFGKQFGILNQTLGYLSEASWSSWLFGGLAEALPISWLGDIEFIKPAIAILLVWKYFGFNIVLYSAGLATIPKQYYEAAAIDGANVFQRLWFISLPLLRPIIFFAVTLTIIGNLQIFEEPFIFIGFNGGTDNAGMTMALYLYDLGFGTFKQMGPAAATSWLLFIIIGVLTAVNFYLNGRGGLENRE